MWGRCELVSVCVLTVVFWLLPGRDTTTLPTPETDNTLEISLSYTTSVGNESFENSTGKGVFSEVTEDSPTWSDAVNFLSATSDVLMVSDESTQMDPAVTPFMRTDTTQDSQTQTGATTQDITSKATPRPLPTHKGTRAAGIQPPDQRDRFEYDYGRLRYQGLVIAFILFVVGILVLFLDRFQAPRCSRCRRRGKSGKYTIAA
ncbi:uncharacterized protein [Chiloscyllium punctatum]|uniref:uncharacterized protein n=1 Tax=Chiloscyllium punctatum TaxID=137246 RepID=UPI003B63AAA5